MLTEIQQSPETSGIFKWANEGEHKLVCIDYPLCSTFYVLHAD